MVVIRDDELQALQTRFSELYAAERNAELLELAETLWRDPLSTVEPQPRIGTICRYAMLTLYRGKNYDNGDVWWHRAVDQYRRSAYLPGLAVMLVTPAFRSADFGRDDVALMIASVLEAVATLGISRVPATELDIPAEQILRICREKYAYCLARCGKMEEAARWYRCALEVLPESEWYRNLGIDRARLKVRGGLALVEFLQHAPEARAHAAIVLRETLAEICGVCAGQELLNSVRRVAEMNLAKLHDAEAVSGLGELTMEKFEHFDIR